MSNIGKTSFEKMAWARHLLKMGLTYSQIQTELKLKFGNGMSNTTLQQIQDEISSLAEIVQLRQENQSLREQLALYKSLYYELKEASERRFTHT